MASIVANSYGFPTEVLPPGYIKPYEHTVLQGVADERSLADLFPVR